jgi:hypothetical protein
MECPDLTLRHRREIEEGQFEAFDEAEPFDRARGR